MLDMPNTQAYMSFSLKYKTDKMCNHTFVNLTIALHVQYMHAQSIIKYYQQLTCIPIGPFGPFGP